MISRRRFLAAMAATPCVAAVRHSGDPTSYPLFRAQGTHRELGRQHGEQASGFIHRHLDVMCAGQKLSRASLQELALKFQPMFERYCPHLLDEMRGLAEGARISLAEALACNIRGEMGRAREEGCTAYAIGRGVTAEGEVIAGQNSDMTSEVPPMAYMLHLKPAGKPEVLIWTFGGMIGYHGMNSAGVAHFANALGGGPAPQFAMPHYPVKRLMLECSTIEEVIELFRKIPLASNGNYVLCDGRGNITDVEATTEGPEIVSDRGQGFIAHTNHYLCPRYATPENLEQSWKDSFPRLTRINEMIAQRRGRVSVDDVKSFLKDHSNGPTSICRHDGDSRTVASLISEPSRRLMHVAVGNPCDNAYVTYRM